MIESSSFPYTVVLNLLSWHDTALPLLEQFCQEAVEIEASRSRFSKALRQRSDQRSPGGTSAALVAKAGARGPLQPRGLRTGKRVGPMFFTGGCTAAHVLQLHMPLAIATITLVDDIGVLC